MDVNFVLLHIDRSEFFSDLSAYLREPIEISLPDAWGTVDDSIWSYMDDGALEGERIDMVAKLSIYHIVRHARNIMIALYSTYREEDPGTGSD